MARTKRDEQGVILIVVLLTMVALLATVALVIDIGHGRQRERSSQNSSDAIALAAVQELPDGDWHGAGTGYAAVNVVPLDQLIRGSWDSSSRTFTAYADQSSPGPAESDQNCVFASTAESNETTFGAVIGQDQLDVSTNAVACQSDQRTTAVAIFGNSETCQNNLQLNGDGTITGGIHTNNDLKIGGGGSDGPLIVGDATYVTDYSGPNATFDPEEDNPRQTGVRPIPVVIPESAYAPGGSRALAAAATSNYVSTTADITGKWLTDNGYVTSSGPALASGQVTLDDPTGITVTDTNANFDASLEGLEIENTTTGIRSFVLTVDSPTQLTLEPGIPAWTIGDGYEIRGGFGISPGLYYTSGDIELKKGQFKDDIEGNGVTFVAGGTITIATSALHLTPWPDPDPVFDNPLHPVLVAYEQYSGGQQCSKAVIDVSGSDHDWRGLIYAPFGLVSLSGADNFSIAGSIVADSVSITGANLNITFPGGEEQFQSVFELVD